MARGKPASGVLMRGRLEKRGHDLSAELGRGDIAASRRVWLSKEEGLDGLCKR
jgi:hypothetical protein